MNHGNIAYKFCYTGAQFDLFATGLEHFIKTQTADLGLLTNVQDHVLKLTSMHHDVIRFHQKVDNIANALDSQFIALDHVVHNLANLQMFSLGQFIFYL